MQLGSTVAQFKILTPYPGTPLYKRMEPPVTETRLGAVRRIHADLQPPESDARAADVPARRRVYTVLHAAVVSGQLPAHHSAARAARSSRGSTRASSGCTPGGKAPRWSDRCHADRLSPGTAPRVLPNTHAAHRGARSVRASSSRARTSREFEDAFARASAGVRARRSTSVRADGVLLHPEGARLSAGQRDRLAGAHVLGDPGNRAVAGLTPVFADVDPASFNMTPESFARVVTPQTVAVVPTHLWGLPCDMDGILEVARAAQPRA